MTDRAYRIGSPSTADVLLDTFKNAPLFTVHGGDLPTPVAVRVGKLPDGELACTAVVIGFANDEAVTSSDLRKVPLPAILSDIVDHVETLRRVGGDPPDERPELADLLALFVEPVDHSVAVPTPRPGPRGHTDEFYRRVAEAYLRAKADPRTRRAPIQALRAMPAFASSDATARRWVQRARDKGFLPPSRGDDAEAAEVAASEEG